MTKLTTFLCTYWLSITEPEYYRDVVKAPVRFSLKYFFGFYFLVSIVLGVVLYVRDLDTIKQISQELVSIVDEDYPADLVIDFQNNNLVYGGNQQFYSLRMPETLNQAIDDPKYDYLVGLGDNPNASETASLINLKQNSLEVSTPNGTDEVEYSELDLNYFRLDRNQVDEFVDYGQTGLIDLINLLPFIFIILSWLILPLVMLTLVAFLTIFVWLVVQLNQFKLTYLKIFQMGLHAVTFAETARLLQSLLFAGIPLPSIFTWAYLGAMMMGLWSMRTPKN